MSRDEFIERRAGGRARRTPRRRRATTSSSRATWRATSRRCVRLRSGGGFRGHRSAAVRDRRRARQQFADSRGTGRRRHGARREVSRAAVSDDGQGDRRREARPQAGISDCESAAASARDTARRRVRDPGVGRRFAERAGSCQSRHAACGERQGAAARSARVRLRRRSVSSLRCTSISSRGCATSCGFRTWSRWWNR